jgi:hypothetical protein
LSYDFSCEQGEEEPLGEGRSPPVSGEGRIGGLFKLWLWRQSAAVAETTEIRKLLVDIEECQLKLKALIGQLSDWMTGLIIG